MIDKLKTLAGKTYRHFMHDSLRRNSILLILSQAVNAGIGFVFWIICAHLFKAGAIGLATAFVSFGVLIATFTNLGLPNTVIRFLPTSKKRGGLFMAALYLVLVFSLIGSGVAWALVSTLVPKLGFIQSSTFLSVTLFLLVVFTALNALLDGTLMAFRRGQYILNKALIVNLPRLILPFFVVTLGMKGIVGIYVVVFAFGITYNIFVILRRLLRSNALTPALAEIKKHKEYAASNYLGGMFGTLPSTLVPIIVLSKLGAESAAYFYIPMQIASFLGIISSSISSALISESSQTDSVAAHKRHFKNAFIHSYRMLLPMIAILCLCAWPVLSIYGRQYAAHGLVPLLILASASLFIAINWLGDTWLNIQKRARAYFLMNAFNAVLVVGFIFMFASHGLVAVSFGWLLGQAVSAIVYLAIFARAEIFSLATSLRTSS